MSPKKILFFVAAGVLVLVLGIGFTLLSNSKSQQKGPK